MDEEMRELSLQTACLSVYDGVWCSAPDYTYLISGNTPLPREQCHLVNATFQMVKIPNWVKLFIDKELNFQMDHQGLGYRFLI